MWQQNIWYGNIALIKYVCGILVFDIMCANLGFSRSMIRKHGKALTVEAPLSEDMADLVNLILKVGF